MPNPWAVVAGTGHREIKTGDPAWLAEQLPKATAWLRDTAGTRIGVSGLALGFDMDWAEAILEAGLTLWVAIPFEGQPARWPKREQARWAKLRAAAARERIVGSIPDDLPKERRSAAVNRLLFRRNMKMLDTAGAVVTDWEPGRLDGGTAGALLEAGKRRMPGVHLDPIGRAVNFELPAAAALQRWALHHPICGHVAIVGTRPLVDDRHALMHAAGYRAWKVRPAKPRETFDDGCDDCQLELVAAAAVPAPA